MPTAPGEWFDPPETLTKAGDGRCRGCGERYRAFRAGVRWSDGVTLARAHNRDEPGYYPAIGPVLWAMRVIKLEEFYARHRWCGQAANDDEEPPPF